MKRLNKTLNRKPLKQWRFESKVSELITEVIATDLMDAQRQAIESQLEWGESPRIDHVMQIPVQPTYNRP